MYNRILKEAALFYKLAQMPGIDQELESPNVVVQPGTPVIQKAVEVLKRMDPNYFKGARQIVVGVSPHFGHVESGPGKDPAVININLNRIVQEAGGQTQGPEVVVAAAVIIAHEAGHVKSFNAQQGFVGGEAPAEQEENRVRQWIEQNRNRLQDLLGM